MKVWIASRGRPVNSTSSILSAGAVRHTIWVEPQQLDEYHDNKSSDFVEFQSIPKGNQGLHYVRTLILEEAKRLGEWVWMLDDDITGFFMTDPEMRRTRRVSAGDALRRAEKVILDPLLKDCAIAALEYQQFAWTAKKPHRFDSYCDVAVALNGALFAEHPELRFREETGLKLDRDIVIQVLKAGLHTVRTAQVAFAAPENGSNEGGCQDDYRSGRELRDSMTMERLWPGIARVEQKPNGRIDCLIDWKKARR